MSSEGGSAKSETKATPSSAVENSVVKIFSQMAAPGFEKPWSKGSATEVTGTGVVIDGKRILTNAHVVTFSSEIQIQANQSGDKIGAAVEAIAPGIDLAVLKLDDEKFFESHPPLRRAEKLPQLRDAVTVYGYPKGGTSLSVTKGIVSRIEFTEYNFPVSGLRIQLDAAINPGNSGGPAVVDDKLIGIAFSHLTDAENIGYVIPCEEIDLFLTEIKDGKYVGKPAFHEETQTLENPALRAYLKLAPDVKGVAIDRPYSNDPSYPLKKWDVVTRIGTAAVDDEGMVKMSENLRVRFRYMVQHVTKNGKIPLTVIRSGKELQVEVPALMNYPLIIPGRGSEYSPYFILGPVVFSEARSELISTLVKNVKASTWLMHLVSHGSPLVTEYAAKQTVPDEKVVFIASPFLPNKLAKGYGNPVLNVVKGVNAHPVKNLKDLVETIRDSKDEFLTFESADRYTETLVFRRKEMIDATESILNDNGIRSQGSAEIMSIWNAKSK